jgi:hypothetical protein
VSIYINTSDGTGGEAAWNKLVDLNENPGEWTWYTPEHYAALSARIRVRLWNSARSKVLSEDGSCTTVTIFNKSLPMFTSGASVDESWPTSAAASITSNTWAVAAVKSHNIATPNMLAMYADTAFGGSPPVQDTVGGATGRSWGVCAVNVDGGPPGPLGLQITNDGSGVLQYLESEELGWGESETDGWWQKNYDIVKAYGFNISSQEAAAPGVKFIRLENTTSGDFVMRLFDTHQRFNAFYDAITTVDDSGAGKGEYLPLGLSPTPGRYLLLLYQKGTILYEGPFHISLVNTGKLAQKIPFEAGRPDTVVHSKRSGTFSFGSGDWMLAGSLPIEKSRWKLEGALSSDFLRSPVTSNMGDPFPNFIVAKRPTAPGDSIHIRCTRLGPSGSTRLDICGLLQEPPLREGFNAPRPWPPGQHFHIVPIRTALPLKFFGISAKDERGGPIAVGIVPDGNVLLHTPTMLWGKDSLDLPNAPNTKEGVAVLWGRPGFPPPASYEVLTRMTTEAEDVPLPWAVPQLEAFPNPCTDVIAVRFSGVAIQPGSAELRDLIGRRVATARFQEIDVEKGIREAWFDMHALPSGIYLLFAPGTAAAPRRVMKYR